VTHNWHGTPYVSWKKNLNDRHHLEDLGVNGREILKLTLKIVMEVVESSVLAVVTTVMNLLVPYDAGNPLTMWDFVFPQNGRVHLNRQGASVQSTTASRGVLISGSNAGYTMSRGSVKGTGCPLHSPVSPSLSLPCVTVCHHISTGLYQPFMMDSTTIAGVWNCRQKRCQVVTYTVIPC